MADQYWWILGELAVVGYSPDGDSLRFIASDPDLWERLVGGDRVELDPDDGSVQLRLDGIDALEKNFRGRGQPLALPARDELLATAGFTNLDLTATGEVRSADPARVPAAVAAALVEGNRRPVALLFTGDAVSGSGRGDGDPVELTPELVDSSVNAALARSGAAYSTVYSTTPAPVRILFTDLARAAATSSTNNAETVWTADRSAEFTLTDQDSIGPDGALIFPKLFRRATAYLGGESERSFVDWLAAGGAENDPVLACGRRATLAELLTQQGDTVRFTGDLFDLVFLE